MNLAELQRLFKTNTAGKSLKEVRIFNHNGDEFEIKTVYFDTELNKIIIETK